MLKTINISINDFFSVISKCVLSVHEVKKLSLISNTLHFDVQLIANIKCPSLYNNNHVIYMAYLNIQWKLSFWRVYISKQYKQLEIITCRILSIWYEEESEIYIMPLEK